MYCRAGRWNLCRLSLGFSATEQALDIAFVAPNQNQRQDDKNQADLEVLLAPVNDQWERRERNNCGQRGNLEYLGKQQPDADKYAAGDPVKSQRRRYRCGYAFPAHKTKEKRETMSAKGGECSQCDHQWVRL